MYTYYVYTFTYLRVQTLVLCVPVHVFIHVHTSPEYFDVCLHVSIQTYAYIPMYSLMYTYTYIDDYVCGYRPDTRTQNSSTHTHIGILVMNRRTLELRSMTR